MKKGSILVLLLVLFSGILLADISRKDELILEGIINDNIYRLKIKDSNIYKDIEAYGSIVANSLVVYVYPKKNLTSQIKKNISNNFERVIKKEILEFKDFEWAKAYKFNVVFRE